MMAEERSFQSLSVTPKTRPTAAAAQLDMSAVAPRLWTKRVPFFTFGTGWSFYVAQDVAIAKLYNKAPIEIAITLK